MPLARSASLKEKGISVYVRLLPLIEVATSVERSLEDEPARKTQMSSVSDDPGECPRKWRSAHTDRQDVPDADVADRLAVTGAVDRASVRMMSSPPPR